MNNEIITEIGNKKYKVFFQPGFYHPVPTNSIHNHIFSEIHFVMNGKLDFEVNRKKYHLKSGDSIFIPAGVYHCWNFVEENTLHTAFQIDSSLRNVSVAEAGAVAYEFFEEIEKCIKTGDYTAISAYIALFYSRFSKDKYEAKPVDDYRFFIHEFFSTRYNEDLRLRDLSDTLHLSERQCERIVKECTGNSFSKELTRVRMEVADRLFKSSDMKKKDIAQYVGYKSYAGFYKAVKQTGAKVCTGNFKFR